LVSLIILSSNSEYFLRFSMYLELFMLLILLSILTAWAKSETHKDQSFTPVAEFFAALKTRYGITKTKSRTWGAGCVFVSGPCWNRTSHPLIMSQTL
jgi:hypothetical protein